MTDMVSLSRTLLFNPLPTDEAEQARWRAQQETDKARDTMRKIERLIPELYWGADVTHPAVKKFTVKLSANLRDGNGLYICGHENRTGKTHNACGVAIAAIEQGYSVRFVRVVGLMSDLASSYRGGGVGEAELIERLSACDLLILDDLGKDEGKDQQGRKLFDIIDRRVMAMKSIIVTTNFTEAELVKHLPDGRGRGIVTRLAECCEAVRFTMEDRRLAS